MILTFLDSLSGTFDQLGLKLGVIKGSGDEHLRVHSDVRDIRVLVHLLQKSPPELHR